MELRAAARLRCVSDARRYSLVPAAIKAAVTVAPVTAGKLQCERPRSSV